MGKVDMSQEYSEEIAGIVGMNANGMERFKNDSY